MWCVGVPGVPTDRGGARRQSCDRFAAAMGERGERHSSSIKRRRVNRTVSARHSAPCWGGKGMKERELVSDWPEGAIDLRRRGGVGLCVVRRCRECMRRAWCTWMLSQTTCCWWRDGHDLVAATSSRLMSCCVSTSGVGLVAQPHPTNLVPGVSTLR